MVIMQQKRVHGFKDRTQDRKNTVYGTHLIAWCSHAFLEISYFPVSNHNIYDIKGDTLEHGQGDVQ